MLFVVRIIAVLVALTVAASFVVFLVTKDQRYLRFAKQLLRFSIVFAAIVMALFVLERVILFL